MITSNVWSIFLGIAVTSAVNLFASESITPSTIRPGERARFEVRITDIPADASPDSFQVFDDLLAQNKKIQILEKAARLENGAFVLSYELTAYQTGDITLAPIQVRYDANTISTESRKLSVSTNRAENDTEIRAEFGELRNPFPWQATFRLLLIAVASYGFFFFLREWLSKVPWHRLSFKRKPRLPKENPNAWLKERMAELKKRIDAGEDDPQLIDEWSWIVRTYYAKKSGLPVSCFTLNEIQRSKTADPFLLFFAESDRFRFSPRREGTALELVVRCFTHTTEVLKCN